MAHTAGTRGAAQTTTLATADAAAGWVDDFDFDREALGGELGQRRRRWRWLIVPVAAVALAAAVLVVLNPFATTAPALVTATASTGTIVSSVSVSGSVASSVVSELSFSSSGTVTAVNVAVGDKVTADQVLAAIDGSALEVQLENAQASLDAAEARLATDETGPTAATIASAKDSVNQAKLQLSTAKQSLADTKAQNALNIAQAKATLTTAEATLAADRKTLPADDLRLAQDEAAVSSATSALSATKLKATLSLHQAQAQVSSATLGVTSARNAYALKVAPATASQIASDKAAVASARLALANLQASGAEITAAIAGTVTAVNIEVGDTVSGTSGSGSSAASSSTTGQIEVMDLGQLQIAGQASETDIAKLRMGQPATITASALGSEAVIGKVCELSVVGTQISGVTSFGVTVCLDGANPALLVGMSATAAVVTSRADNAVLVPSLAVRTVGGQQVVTVLDPDGRTQASVPVTVGITNGSQTQILSGITDGTTVVLTLQSTTNNRGVGGGGIREFSGPGGFGGG